MEGPRRILSRRRVAALACLALLAPLPALGAGEGEATASIAVSASLDSCGLLGSQVVCKLDASWSQPEGATRYTASVAAPDGSVTDAGEVPAGGTSIWVPYVGDGTYSVRVSAYGNTDSDPAEEPIATGRSGGGAAGLSRGAERRLGGGERGTVGEAGEVEAPDAPVEPEPQPEVTAPTTTTPETTTPEPVAPEPEPEPVCTDPTPEQIAEREAIEADREAQSEAAREAGEPEPVFEPLPPLEPVCEPAP